MISVFSFIHNYKKYGLLFFKIYFCGIFFHKKKIIYSKKIEKNKKISIYGFGPYGEKAFIYFFPRNDIVNIYDKKFYLKPLSVSPIYDICNDIEFFDYIIVTVMNYEMRKAVENFLKNRGVPERKIVYVNYSFSAQ